MRIAEFTVDVPLAAIDDDSSICDNYSYASDLQAVFGLIESIDNSNNNNNNNFTQTSEILQQRQNANSNGNFVKNVFCEQKNTEQEPQQQQQQNSSPDTETFSETMGGSLEDLVGHFDEKISHCFKNLTEETENIAPVQMRTQEEIMNESQIWWTLTGNFGNILPIDWSKSYARKLQLPALHLRPKDTDTEESSGNDLDISDDEELAQALDLHSLIASQLSPTEPPPQTADEVIEEIDEIIMQQSCTSEWTACSDMTTSSGDSLSYSYSPLKSPFAMSCSVMAQNTILDDRVREASALASCPESLWDMSYKDLVSLHSEMESLIQIHNETLVQELAARDEGEYEKELKNTFISLLLSIQNKRRQWNLERKRKVSDGKTIQTAFLNGENLPQCMTTIIPYDDDFGPLDNMTLERLIKILRAVNDDNPNVPNMLTDYILNVICPSTTTSLSLPW